MFKIVLKMYYVKSKIRYSINMFLCDTRDRALFSIRMWWWSSTVLTTQLVPLIVTMDVILRMFSQFYLLPTTRILAGWFLSVQLRFAV